MKVKGILFNTDMVRAILDGRKMVTRRLIKKPVIKQDRDNDLFYLYENENSDDCFSIASWKNTVPDIMQYSPYQPGDILYVREKWQYAYDLDDNDHIIEETGRYLYYADNPMPFNNWLDSDTGEYKDYMPWKPSIHMPKEAARIWLKVTDVRVERLREITFSEIAREGINPKLFEGEDGVNAKDFVESYVSLWDSTIKKKDLPLYGWDTNPWVWVIEFERTVKPDE